MSLTYILTGGGFSDGEGNPLSDGVLSARLLRACTDLATGTLGICNEKITYALDVDGNVSTNPPQFIIPSDFLSTDFGEIGLPAATPLDTFYMLATEDENGQGVWGPNAVFLNSTNAFSFEVETPLSPTNGIRTDFVLPDTPVTHSLIVYSNGLAMIQGVDYTLSGVTISFTSAPAASDEVIADYYVGTESFLPTFAQENFGSGSTAYTLFTTPVTGTAKVFQGGLLQSPDGVSYSISGATITFNTATTEPVYVVYQITPGVLASTGQVPAGILNGVNRVFTLSSPAPVSLYVNGVRQDGSAYKQVGPTITLNLAPLSWYQLYSYYDAQQFLSLNDIVPSNP